MVELAQVCDLIHKNQPAVYPGHTFAEIVARAYEYYKSGDLLVAGCGIRVDGMVFAKRLLDGALEVEALIANNPVAVTWLFRQLINLHGDRPLTFKRGNRRVRFQSTTYFFKKWAATSKQQM